MTGLLPGGHTVLRYMSPNGQVLQLAGPGAGSEGVWLGDGPDGLGSVDVKAIFEAAARQYGETYVGETMDHLELDLPIHILGDSPDDFRRKKSMVANTIERHRQGWLTTYTTADGWRWLAVRKLGMQPAYDTDPGPKRGATFDLLLVAESPLAREVNPSDEWVNKSGSGRGELHLYPGPGEWPSWAQFILRGPGRFRLRWAGNDIEFPQLAADEWALVNTDEARPTLRGRDARGRDTNLWPRMRPGVKIEHPLRPREVNRVDVTVWGGSAQSSAFGTVAVQHEGLV